MAESSKIGIIGGMGPVASSELYSRILEVCQNENSAVQDSDYPEIFLDSVSFQGSDESGITDKDKVLEQFLEALDSLEYAGSDLVLVPCNTLHSLVKHLRAESNAEIIDMVDETVSRIESDGFEKVGLLASETSYKQDIYENRTDSIEFVYPDKDEREELSQIILNVMGGNHTKKDRKRIIEIAENLHQSGSDAIVLGCTELPVVVNSGDFDQNVYDTIQILAEAAVE